MNNQLQIELSKIVAGINKGTNTAVDFLNEQTPELVQQLLMWEGISNLIKCVVGILLTFTTILVLIKLVFPVIEKHASDDKEGFYAGTFVLALIIQRLIFIELYNLTWLKIWLAPKVWLLEYVSKLIK
jgi:hypothetical protein